MQSRRLKLEKFFKSIAARVRAFRHWVQHKVPPGLRSVLGLVLIGLGFFWFLPILGIWLVPLGVFVIYCDISDILRRIRGRRRD